MSSTLESVHIRTDKPKASEDELTYEQQHKPSSEFESREQYLEHELQIMAPKRWRPNLPFKDYRFEVEDTIPAMSTRPLVKLLWWEPLQQPLPER